MCVRTYFSYLKLSCEHLFYEKTIRSAYPTSWTSRARCTTYSTSSWSVGIGTKLSRTFASNFRLVLIMVIDSFDIIIKFREFLFSLILRLDAGTIHPSIHFAIRLRNLTASSPKLHCKKSMPHSNRLPLQHRYIAIPTLFAPKTPSKFHPCIQTLCRQESKRQIHR